MQLGGLGTDEAEAGPGPQIQDLPDATDLALLEDEVAQRAAGDRFQLLADRHLRPLQRHRRIAGLLDAGAEADIEKVRIVRTPLPHSRSADHGVQLLRVTVHEQLAAAQILCGALNFFAILVELAQVDTPLLFLLAPGDSPASTEAPAE